MRQKRIQARVIVHALRELKEEECECEANLGYKVRPFVKQNKIKGKGNNKTGKKEG